MTRDSQRGLSAAIVRIFTVSHLSPMLLIAALIAGIAALQLTPREEDPQIVVPVMDVMIDYPGASAEEVEKLAATPLEAMLKQIQGVEHVFSASQPGRAVVTVGYYVGEDPEDSLVKTWSKVMSNQDRLPPDVRGWNIKPVDIDDVPMLMLTLSSSTGQTDAMGLRRIADELLASLSGVDNIAKTEVIGGARRQVSIYPDSAKMTGYGIALQDIIHALQAANVHLRTGRFRNGNRETVLEAGAYFASADEVAAAVVKAAEGRAVYLRDIARVIDGEEEREHYTRIGFGPAVSKMRTVGRAEDPKAKPGDEREMVSIALAKRKGSNAVKVSQDILAVVAAQRDLLIPADVEITVSRDYGATADHKVNELVKHLGLAIAIILVLLALALGPKESLIVCIAVPVTFAITLLADLVFGYTINRVTLFALILSLGLLVDDPIVDVENIFRHFKLKKEPPLEALLSAVDEVRPPTIVATLAVMLAFIPMFFITGMIGPYLAPLAFNIPVAMLISLLVAFTITPWASYLLLRGEYGKDEAAFDLKTSNGYRFYRRLLGPLIASPARSRMFLIAVGIAFLLSSLLAVTRAVPLKLLPFDNKNELQIVVDMPAGSTLEKTDAVIRALGRYLATVNEVTDYESYIGLASPIDFNGMIRHYYLRAGNRKGDIRINLLPKDERVQQSHQIAMRIRGDIERIGRQYGAKLKIVELPPGPPVLSTLVAEVYGPADGSYGRLIQTAERIKQRFRQIAGVVDIDDLSEAPDPTLLFRIDKQKAALLGVSPEAIVWTLGVALESGAAGTLHVPGERLPLEIRLRLPRAERSSLPELLNTKVRSSGSALIALSELGTLVPESGEPVIHHKDLERVAYVIGDSAGRSPVEAIIDLYADFADHPLPEGYRAELSGEGEWKITAAIFRDLGISFGASLIMIYVLLVVQTGSLSLPAIMMIAIPLTIIGIMPGFWLLNVFFAETIAGFTDSIYFTATAMVGMIALAGIVVRNGIILIDFIERTRARSDIANLEEALIEAGATRMRPIFLTAGAAMFGSVVIILDPIFSGLAWSFIFGIFASTGFSLFVIPVVYYLIYRDKPGNKEEI
ncbi:efflux RND transporter permease subunit [Methylomicrobium sp. RS1]|uniref:efflux RND transporter permease subunit n=1 Tax=Candidatus Methylomicrobium oryzae TaxID=2802053 RepID=UPI0019215320|nr:efflux RND transporter permease subunit [Methylomicrobium sp. RS1]MBL1262412.1 efflux RND transporter permease subunit [Methylomicrobium sp. RS1]